jgi:hypothetical protein
MSIVLIDYTSLYYLAVAKSLTIPSLTTGKFVQIRNGNTLTVVISPKEFTKYHANIIERFCMDKGLEGSYDSRREKFTIHDQAWQIVGGGKFERDMNKKTLRLYDNSMAYGKFDTKGLKEMLGALPELSGYTITIE